MLCYETPTELALDVDADDQGVQEWCNWGVIGVRILASVVEFHISNLYINCAVINYFYVSCMT